MSAPRKTAVVLDVAEAIAVGQNLRTLSRDRRTPLGVRDVFARVGDKLVKAGLAELQLEVRS